MKKTMTMTAVLRRKIKPAMLAIGLVTCSAIAEEAKVKSVSWVYSISGGDARIERLNQIYTGKLAIPAKIGKYRVTSIAGENPIAANPGPKAIAVPASVTSIGAFAFGGNANLKSVVLPAQLPDIADALFHTCENLTSVKIPASVRRIGTEAFAECRNLKAIEIPEGVTNISPLAFRDCSKLASVTIPASVTSIGEGAFRNCTKLLVIYTATGNAERLKAVIAEHGKTDFDKIRIEEKVLAKGRAKAGTGKTAGGKSQKSGPKATY